MLLQLGSEESLCVSPASLAAVLSLKFPYWVKNKRRQTFIFSVVMLIKEHVLCPASVSWHPPAPASPCPVELEAAGSHPTLPGSCGWNPQHLVLSCARNMKAWGEKGTFPKKCPNPFSKLLQLLVLVHGDCCSDQMLASWKEIPFWYFSYFILCFLNIDMYL